jgi:hypothetical protein
MGFGLEDDHFGSLQALGALLDAKLYLLSLLQSPETFRLNCGVMHEDIRSALALNEAIAFARIEPLNFADNTVIHIKLLLAEYKKMLVGLVRFFSLRDAPQWVGNKMTGLNEHSVQTGFTIPARTHVPLANKVYQASLI